MKSELPQNTTKTRRQERQMQANVSIKIFVREHKIHGFMHEFHYIKHHEYQFSDLMPKSI